MRNHPADRSFDQQFGMARPTRAHVFRFMAADVSRKTHVGLLFFFLSGDTHLVGIDHDDEVAGIDVGRENRLFLAAQKLGRFDCDTAENLILGVDQPPAAVYFIGFGGKSLHQQFEKGTETTGQPAHCQPTQIGAELVSEVLSSNYNAPSYYRPRRLHSTPIFAC